MMTVTQRQNLLQYLGYYDGRVDGISGPLTEGAEEAFRADNGNPCHGDELDEVLIGAVFHSKFKGSNASEKPNNATQEHNTGVDFWSTVKYFGRHEFACKCGRCGGYPVEPSEKLLRVLDEIRDRIGEPVYINSGIRCPQHNASIDGASPKSRHMNGDAADIRAENTSPRALYDIACETVGTTGGVGLYDWGVHVDTRGYKARW